MTTKQIDVSILDQTYRLACSEETEAALRAAAVRVDTEMSAIRTRSSIRGIDRIAVMAALSLASELLKLQNSIQQGEAFPADEIRHAMQQMNARLNVVLEQQKT